MLISRLRARCRFATNTAFVDEPSYRDSLLQLFYQPPTISIPPCFTLALVGAMPPTSAKGEKKCSNNYASLEMPGL